MPPQPIALSLLAAVPLLAVNALWAAPGDASRGEDVLASQKCAACHRFGPQWSPDLPPTLVKLFKSNLTPGRLAAEMWNHAPLMWTAIEARNQPFPTLSEQQASDLTAYFFAAGYFDTPGDPHRGERVFTSGGCHVCHLMESGQGGGPAVSAWGIASVTDLLQGMWSHWPAMNAAMGRRRLVWPAVSAEQMRDLLAFVRSRFPEKRKPEMRAGSSEAGRTLFEEKGCAACHQGDMDLSQYPHVRSFTQLASSFWNHIPMMTRAPPLVSDQEMADILAYLWSIRYFEESGSARRGKAVFQAKQCGKCHPARPRAGFTVASMIAALWKHPPAVVAKMKQNMILWPTFLPGEIEDLIALYRTVPR